MRREELATQKLVISNGQAGASRQLKRGQAASQAAFKDTQDAAAALDAEQLNRQAILADRVCPSPCTLAACSHHCMAGPLQCTSLQSARRACNGLLGC